MPKRIASMKPAKSKAYTRREKERQQLIRNTVTICKTAMNFAYQTITLLEEKAIDVLVLSNKTGIALDRLINILHGDYYAFISLNTDEITSIANVLDIAIEVKFKSFSVFNKEG